MVISRTRLVLIIAIVTGAIGLTLFLYDYEMFIIKWNSVPHFHEESFSPNSTNDELVYVPFPTEIGYIGLIFIGISIGCFFYVMFKAASDAEVKA